MHEGTAVEREPLWKLTSVEEQVVPPVIGKDSSEQLIAHPATPKFLHHEE